MHQLILSKQSRFLLGLALLFVLLGSFRALNVADTTTFYVLAPSGLNLRKDADPNSAKVDLVPLGGKVTLLTAPATKNLSVDQLSGGMAKVKYGDKVGFVFDGYLSQFPAPKQSINTPGDYKLETYVEKLRSGPDVFILHEEHTKDYGGYLSSESAIHIPTQNWQEAFLISKLLLNIPPKFLFPKPSKAVETIIPNPDKKEQAWSDEMKVERDKTGQLISINYYYRSEGGGWGAVITKSTEESGQQKMLKIAYTGIAD
ncbi:SH3 domain-containing protein [Haliscomenobacter hydrossis]|uniref:SH3b domain-containing protein n=1 Tax=Haliscomenobacter hydrossis (strain ATCC 27775 / DSM 1100 / LMG 10767 / O) TaxID=760192 RepID=F4KU14_HALH1|nr:SH3 domain-containing protein [Haliscomenobacter hydrossis]AEE49150.1 hypothetical protein Halhy_1255 [Haliscomenobacter hydrossis DSM 1100]